MQLDEGRRRGDYCPIKPSSMKSDPHVLHPNVERAILSTSAATADFERQRDTLEQLFHTSSSGGSSTNTSLQHYLDRALCARSHKKVAEARETVRRMYKDNLPKVVSSHIAHLLYQRVLMNMYQRFHDTKMHRQFKYRTGRPSLVNEHPFYGQPAVINGDKSRYEEYLAFLVLTPLADYKSSYKCMPRNFIISQYLSTADEELTGKDDTNLRETINSYLYKVVVMGMVDPVNQHKMISMRDLINYQVPFDESRYPRLAALTHMALCASFLSVLTMKTSIMFRIFRTDSLEDVMLYSDKTHDYFYNMRQDVLIYNHLKRTWYYQLHGADCYWTDNFFCMFDDLLTTLIT